MRFVKFIGSTPYQETSYEDYLVLSEDDLDIIDRESINFAIENAQRHDNLIDFSQGDNPNLIYLDYLQKCINNAHWEFVTEDEFLRATSDL